MKRLSKFLVFALAILGANTVWAQASLKGDEAKKRTEVKELINSKRYTFEATKMVSKKGDSKVLQSGNDFDISKDTLIAYLPTVGKPEGAPVRAINSGITCTHFSYTKQQSKNGGWNVTIIPKEKFAKNEKDIKKINMAISKNGYATLTVNFTDRNPVAFYGYITEHNAMFRSSGRMAASDQ
ncbi:MAG TPA: DUF4251 domain-containing protein [Mucilaginibacter sp.]|jgi:hypothetical protein|nr:DUF4251 domain-containing protein [Mucilaginibacter sp.]